MRAVLIMNPVSGISTLATSDGTVEEHEQAVLAALRLHGIEAKVMYTTPEDPGARLAAQAAAEQAEVVIAAGGDGTIHEVATGLIGSQTALGIIPLGTMNNLAHSLNISETIEEACAAIATGETVSIDVGKINEQYFLEVAGIGLEAALFPAAEELKSPGVLSTLHGIIEGLCITNFFGLLIYLLATNWRSGKLRNILIAICTALITFIGPSRVHLGAHWPSDVMAGYLYGELWFGGLMALYLRIKAWIHPAISKTPEVMKPLEQPGEQE